MFRWPWISRAAHDEMVGLLQARIRELEASQRLYVDRLGVLGLGGPIFSPVPAPVEPSEAEPEESDERGNDELQRLLHLKRRPSQMADALTRKLARDEREKMFGPRKRRVFR